MKNIRIILLAIVCLLFSISVANANDKFVYIGIDQNGNEYTLDKSTIEQHNGYVSCMYIMEPTTAKGLKDFQNFVKDDSAVIMLSRIAFSNDKRYEQTLMLIACNHKGEIVKKGEFKFDKKDFTLIEKGSMLESICSIAFKNKK